MRAQYLYGLQPIRSIPAWLSWIRYVSWFYYGYSALMINQWTGVEDIACQSNSTSACIKTGREVLQQLNIEEVRPDLRPDLRCYSLHSIWNISVKLGPGYSTVGPTCCPPQDLSLPRSLLESKEEISVITCSKLNHKQFAHQYQFQNEELSAVQCVNIHLMSPN